MGISQYSESLIERLIKAIGTDQQASSENSVLTFGRQTMWDHSAPEVFFKKNGFGIADSLDSSDFEGANIVHDMNEPINESLHERYSLVIDGGTLEHVFDVKTFLFNCASLVKLHGHVLHQVPLNNHINHGFYQVSPTLLYAFYEDNGFTPLSIGMHFLNKASGTAEREMLWVENPEQLKRIALSCRIVLPDYVTPNTLVSMTFFARKTDRMQLSIPQQPFYSKKYQGNAHSNLKSIFKIPG